MFATVIGGVDDGGYYLLSTFDNKDPEEVRELLQVMSNYEDDPKVVYRDDEITKEWPNAFVITPSERVRAFLEER